MFPRRAHPNLAHPKCITPTGKHFGSTGMFPRRARASSTYIAPCGPDGETLMRYRNVSPSSSCKRHGIASCGPDGETFLHIINIPRRGRMMPCTCCLHELDGGTSPYIQIVSPSG